MNGGLIGGGDLLSPLVDPPRDTKRDEEVKEMRLGSGLGVRLRVRL